MKSSHKTDALLPRRRDVTLTALAFGAAIALDPELLKEWRRGWGNTSKVS
jgi:hypothetical protein